tara:strand:+ start:643 stop:798 length:156 start_codon:yes stop_codon:yes gene_type:complete
LVEVDHYWVEVLYPRQVAEVYLLVWVVYLWDLQRKMKVQSLVVVYHLLPRD